MLSRKLNRFHKLYGDHLFGIIDFIDHDLYDNLILRYFNVLFRSIL